MNRPNKQVTGSGIVAKPAALAWKDRLLPEDLEELKNVFEVFDEDRSGTIDPVEITKIIEELGLEIRNPFVMNIISALRDKNKPINFHEFVDTVCPFVGETRTKDGLKRVFALYDQNEDGYIDFEEFHKAKTLLGDTINDDEITEMMHSAFINHKTSSNEAFNFDEFYLIVTRFYAQK